ncbi:SOS response-associated peptidase family protein [Falsiroseomonas oryziterrae]|uniref:SOS response-associated peptidase family protein n=1 Tax=Falsiroseomonas oryziterrae TaxID=2911368 RepID=UPI001F216617|nr:SOS response-associated peptidase family protein [Roseomonas sp. NPKOSM-4]
MPRGVLFGEPELLGAPPFERAAGERCLALLQDPYTGDVVAAALRWGLPRHEMPRRPRLTLPVEGMRGRRLSRKPRCLIPVGGYVQPSVRRSRIAVGATVDLQLAIPAIWDASPQGPSFAILTTRANELLELAHTRMPVLLPPALWSNWLSAERLGGAELAILEQPAPSAWLKAAGRPRTSLRLTPATVERQLDLYAPGSELWDWRAEHGFEDTPAGVPSDALG